LVDRARLGIFVE
jgi:hypothetical protein